MPAPEKKTASVDVSASLKTIAEKLSGLVDEAYEVVRASKGDQTNTQYGITQGAMQAHRTLQDVELAVLDIATQTEARATQKLEAQKSAK